MRLRCWTWALWALWSTWALCCACAAASSAEELHHADVVGTSLSPPSSLPDCDSLQLFNAPPLPANVREHEALVVHTARALAELIEEGVANVGRFFGMALDIPRLPLSPPPVAVAFSAPQQNLNVLYVVGPPRLVIFKLDNSAALQPFWRILASAWNASSVVWSNPAWFSCETEGRGWWAGAAAARGAGPRRAAAAIFRRIQALPCEDAMNEWLGEAPRCDSLTTECLAVPSDSIKTKLQYSCRCLSSHWHEQGSGWWSGKELARSQRQLVCTACDVSSEAAVCLGDTYGDALLAANLIGMLFCLVVGLILYKKRKNKAVAMGMWKELAVDLLGALLMYLSAATQFMSELRWRCIVGAWLRELGFVSSYGSVVLLAEFRTRSAHRWKPRDAEVLRIVAAMVVVCVCYLSAFTAIAVTWEGVECVRATWHHVTAAAEVLLLAVGGAKLAYATKKANVPFQVCCLQERGWLAVALCLEGACGAAWRVAALLGAAPERSPLAATVRAHLSSGMVLAFVLAPRLWHGYRVTALAREVSRRGSAEEFELATLRNETMMKNIWNVNDPREGSPLQVFSRPPMFE